MNDIQRRIHLRPCLAVVAAFAFAGMANAQASATTAPAASAPITAPAELADGEVRKIDKDNAKITLKHGPLKNFDMPGMTMVFGVGEPAMLDRVQVGDKIRFAVEKVNGKLTVVRIEPQS